MAQMKPYLLTVLSGPNAGASTRFGTGSVSVGGGDPDQIILSGVAPGSLTLCGVDDRLRVSANQPDIRREDGETGALVPLQPGLAQEAALPLRLRLNDQTSILLTCLVPVQRTQLSLRSGLAIAAVSLASGLWIGAQFGGPATPALAAPSPSPAETRAVEAIPAQVPAPAPAHAATPAAAGGEGLRATSPRLACNADCIESTATDFAARLIEAGLTGLSVKPQDGVLRVAGTLSADQTDTWRRLRARFEAEHGQSLPLVAQITEGDPAPLLAVASVWLGRAPEVRTKGGAVLHIGDTTGDGWTVAGISAGEIRLSRGAEQVAVRF